MILLTNLTIVLLILVAALTAFFQLSSRAIRVLTFSVLLQPLLFFIFPISEYTYIYNFSFYYPVYFLMPLYLFFLYYFFLICISDINKSFSITLIILLFSVLSLNTLISSKDLFVVFFSAELFTILSFLLLISGTSETSFFFNSAILKYFLFSSILTSILFLLTCNIHATCETTDFYSLHYYYFGSSYSFLKLFFGVLLFKLGVFPFYFIYVDLYDYLSWRLFFFFNYISKIFLMLLVVIFFNFFNVMSEWVTLLALFSIFIGAIGIFNTSRLRRLLIFSSLFNIGNSLLLLFLEFGALSYTYLFVYSLLSSFLIFSFVYYERMGYTFNTVDDLVLAQYASFVSYFSVILLTLTGLPPFSFF